ncbi:MAG: hypothetical protein QM608_16170 [Caulobacter sp.]
MILCLCAGLAACAPAPDDAPVATWARWGMPEAQVVAGSQGRLSPARLDDAAHIQAEPEQLISTGCIQKDGRWYDATFTFDRRSRELFRIALHLDDRKVCADLLKETLARRGRPDRLLQTPSANGDGGMYVWSGKRPLMLNDRPAFSDCALIYTAPRTDQGS